MPTARMPSDADVALLWAASRIDPVTEDVVAAARDADIPYVLDAAERQRVAPIVLRSLEAAGFAFDQESEVLRRAKLWEAHERLALPTAARSVLVPLAQAGLRPLALKGLGLIGRYPAQGLRPMDDIDILLPRPLALAAIKVLRRAGWRRVRHRGPDPRYDIVFRHPSVRGVPLELHYELARWQERPKGLDARRLWASRRETEVLGQPAWGLSPELELVTLIAHAAKRFHLFNRLLWIVDISVVVRSAPIDWDEFGRLATDAHSRIAAAVALQLARRLGTNVPHELLRIPGVAGRTGAVDSLLDPARPFSVALPQRRIAYVLVDDVAGKARLALGDLMRPPSGQPRTRVAGNVVRTLERGATRLARTGLGRNR